MAARGECYAAGSQDFDSLLFGAPRLLRNITISGRRKLPGRNAYTDVQPELIVLDELLRTLKLTREQLVEVGLLCGTDFNEGVPGIGPRKALKIVSEGKFGEYDLSEFKDIFLNPPVTDDFEVRFGTPDPQKVTSFLCGEHEFSESRVDKALQRLTASGEGNKQTSLDSFF
jgi:flap endonuclease-1